LYQKAGSARGRKRKGILTTEKDEDTEKNGKGKKRGM
jgi:hypothetical protein